MQHGNTTPSDPEGHSRTTPADEELIHISVRIPVKLNDAVDLAVARGRTTKQALITECLSANRKIQKELQAAK